MSQYIKVKYRNNEINGVIITNTIKMLLKRHKSYSENEVNKLVASLKDSVSESIVNLKISDKKYSVNITNGKLNSIPSNSPLDDFLTKNLDVTKIIVVKNPSKRFVKQVYKYVNTEFFFFHDLLIDKTEPYFVPEHILLDDKEKELLQKKIKLNDLSTIFDTDMMGRYYRAKEGDVFKIIRPNPTCGNSIYYRLVQKGKLDILFMNTKS